MSQLTHQSNSIRQIKSNLAVVAQSVEQALQHAIESIPCRNRQLAQETIVADHAINRSIRDIDQMCQQWLKDNPLTDRNLRLITSILRLNIALERLGDYAVTISRETLQLTKPITSSIIADIQAMSSDASRMLHQSIKAFNEGSVALANGAIGYADHVERTFGKVFDKLVMPRIDAAPADLLAIFTVFTVIERVSDQAKNICEETIFVVEGIAKQTKVYRILFVEKRNDLLSQMAVAIGKKRFRGAAEFTSAGIGMTHQLNPELISTMEDSGYDLSDEKPKRLSEIDGSLDSYHVIIALNAPIATLIQKTPFHTLGLSWQFEDSYSIKNTLLFMENQLEALISDLRDRRVF